MADDTTRLGPEEVVERRTTRRELVRKGAVGALVVAYGGATAKTSAYGAPRFAKKQLAGTLRIMQWLHFVPSYDTWFDNTYVKQWGQRNDTEVIVDHVALAELPARAAAEVAAQRGHDLFQVLSPPAAFEDQVISHNEIVQEISRRIGKMGPVGYKSTYNPKTRKYFGVPDNYVPDPVHYRRDLWRNVGRAPNTWDDIRQVAERLKGTGNPVGIGMSQELDSNMANMALMMCYGGFLQNQSSRVTLRSAGTINALRAMRDIYSRGHDPGGVRLDRGVEQPGVRRRAALARAQRDLDRAHARRAAVGDDACARRAECEHVDRADPPRAVAAHGPRARDGHLHDLAVRQQQGDGAQVPRRHADELPAALRELRLLQLPRLAERGPRRLPRDPAGDRGRPGPPAREVHDPDHDRPAVHDERRATPASPTPRSTRSSTSSSSRRCSPRWRRTG